MVGNGRDDASEGLGRRMELKVIGSREAGLPTALTGCHGQPEIWAKNDMAGRAKTQRPAITPQAIRLPELPAGCDL